MTSNGKSLNDSEIDFISSLKSLMVRYGVSISMSTSKDFENDINNYFFSNDVNEEMKKEEILLSIDEIFEYLSNKK